MLTTWNLSHAYTRLKLHLLQNECPHRQPTIIMYAFSACFNFPPHLAYSEVPPMHHPSITVLDHINFMHRRGAKADSVHRELRAMIMVNRPRQHCSLLSVLCGQLGAHNRLFVRVNTWVDSQSSNLLISIYKALLSQSEIYSNFQPLGISTQGTCLGVWVVADTWKVVFGWRRILANKSLETFQVLPPDKAIVLTKLIGFTRAQRALLPSFPSASSSALDILNGALGTDRLIN